MGSGLSDNLNDLSVEYAIPLEDHFDLLPYHMKTNSNDKHSTLPNGNSVHSNLPWFYRDSQEVTIVNKDNIQSIKVNFSSSVTMITCSIAPTQPVCTSFNLFLEL